MIAVLLLAFGQASGAIWLGGDTCDENCGDSGDGKQCPPNCPTCACALTTQTVPATPVVIVEPARAVHRVDFVDREQFLPNVDPREILHIPKHDA
jgi:hypothetical protein